MTTSTAALNAREAFMQENKALDATVIAAAKAAGVKVVQPASETPASAKTESQPTAHVSESQPAAEVQDQSTESPTEDTVDGEIVDTSDADSTPADAADDTAPADPSETGTIQPKKPNRIQELLAERKALRDYIKYREAQGFAPAAQPQPEPTAATPAATTTQPSAAATEAPPTLESCGFDTDQWTREMQTWTAKQIETGVAKAVQTAQHKQTTDTAQAAFNKRMDAFAAKTPDLKVVLGNPDLPKLSPEAAGVVVASDLAPQILYHLGKNPDKAVRIARQSPAQQSAAIGAIEAELKLKASKPAQQKSTITRAPAPPSPTSGGSVQSTTDITKMSMKDFVAAERLKLAQRRQQPRAAKR